MRFYNLALFIDKSLISHLRYNQEDKSWPITLVINNSNESYHHPQIDIYFSNESSYINFKNSVIHGYEKYLRNKKESRNG